MNIIISIYDNERRRIVILEEITIQTDKALDRSRLIADVIY
ncbi:MAG: hypothetical protein QW416_05160 [Candidatus Nitrosocaldaceae archaeon]